jgi:hypothetical protein
VKKPFKKKTKQFVCISCADTIETETKIKQNEVPPSQHNVSITVPIPEKMSIDQRFSEQSPPSVESSSNESQVPLQVNSDKLEQRQRPKQFPKFWLDLNVGWDDASTEKIEQGMIIRDLLEELQEKEHILEKMHQLELGIQEALDVKENIEIAYYAKCKELEEILNNTSDIKVSLEVNLKETVKQTLMEKDALQKAYNEKCHQLEQIQNVQNQNAPEVYLKITVCRDLLCNIINTLKEKRLMYHSNETFTHNLFCNALKHVLPSDWKSTIKDKYPNLERTFYNEKALREYEDQPCGFLLWIRNQIQHPQDRDIHEFWIQLWNLFGMQKVTRILFEKTNGSLPEGLHNTFQKLYF